MICIRLVGGRTRQSLARGALALAAALGGCNSPSEPLGRTATVPQATTTTDPYAVPAVIDEAYVNRVLAGLDQAVGDVTRLIITTRTIPPEAIDRLMAIYMNRDLLQLTVDVYQENSVRGFAGSIPNPGNRLTTVMDLITAGPSCIFAKVDTDLSAVLQKPSPSFRIQWVALVPIGADQDPNRYNPTSWGYVYEGFTRDLTAPEDPCASS